MSNNLTVANVKNYDSIAADVAMQLATTGTDQIPVYDDADICAHWGITVEELQSLKGDPKFVTAVRSAMHVIKTDAPHLATKARMLLEMSLDNLIPTWLKDDKASLSDKNKLLDNLVKIAGLLERYKAQEEAKTPAATAAGPVINLTLQQLPAGFAVVQEKEINPR